MFEVIEMKYKRVEDRAPEDSLRKICFLVSSAIGQAKNGFVDIVATYNYDTPAVRAIYGTSVDGFTIDAIDPREVFLFNFEQFKAALEENDLGLVKMPEPVSGLMHTYAYRIGKEWKVNLSKSVWGSRAAPPQSAEREEQVRRWEARFGVSPSPDDLVALFGEGGA